MLKTKLIAGFSILFIFLLYVAGQSTYSYIQKQKDYNRVIDNQVNLIDSLKYYRDREGRETAVSPVLEYKLNEVLKILPDVQADLKELKIKSGRVQSVAQTGISQQLSITKPLRDTNIIQNHITIPAKTITYSNAWYNIWGIITADSAKLNISSTDTLIQVISRGNRVNPWLWFFSRRELIQTIQSRNPNNKIIYSRYIKIKE